MMHLEFIQKIHKDIILYNPVEHIISFMLHSYATCYYVMISYRATKPFAQISSSFISMEYSLSL